MTTPFLIFVDGPMGSGKTTTTTLLNQMLPDTARVALPDIKRLIPNYRENEKTLTVIREVMKVMTDKYLEFGVSVIVECISKNDSVEAFRHIAEKHNAAFFAYRLSAPKNIRMKRVIDRTKGMMNIEELPESKITELEGYFEPNDSFYQDNPVGIATIIDTGGLTAEQVAGLLISKLS